MHTLSFEENMDLIFSEASLSEASERESHIRKLYGGRGRTRLTDEHSALIEKARYIKSIIRKAATAGATAEYDKMVKSALTPDEFRDMVMGEALSPAAFNRLYSAVRNWAETYLNAKLENVPPLSAEASEARIISVETRGGKRTIEFSPLESIHDRYQKVIKILDSMARQDLFQNLGTLIRSNKAWIQEHYRLPMRDIAPLAVTYALYGNPAGGKTAPSTLSKGLLDYLDGQKSWDIGKQHKYVKHAEKAELVSPDVAQKIDKDTSIYIKRLAAAIGPMDLPSKRVHAQLNKEVNKILSRLKEGLLDPDDSERDEKDRDIIVRAFGHHLKALSGVEGGILGAEGDEEMKKKIKYIRTWWSPTEGSPAVNSSNKIQDIQNFMALPPEQRGPLRQKIKDWTNEFVDIVGPKHVTVGPDGEKRGVGFGLPMMSDEEVVDHMNLSTAEYLRSTKAARQKAVADAERRTDLPYEFSQ
jgi:hypothetical protein